MNDLSRLFGLQLVAIAAVMVVSGCLALVFRGRRRWPFGLDPAAGVLSVGALVAIAIATLTPQSNATSSGRLELRPLSTIGHYRGDPSDLLIYLGGNLALFAPLGFCLALALRRGIVGATLIGTLACAVTSITVEVLQLPIWSRSSDVDDVLTNTLGGGLGALTGGLLLRLLVARGVPDGPPVEFGDPTYAVGSRLS